MFMNARRRRAASSSRRRLPSRSMRRWAHARNVSDRCRRAGGHALRCLPIPLKVNAFLQWLHTALSGVEFLWSSGNDDDRRGKFMHEGRQGSSRNTHAHLIKPPVVVTKVKGTNHWSAMLFWLGGGSSSIFAM